MERETAAHEELANLDPTEKNIAGLINRRRAKMDQEQIEQSAADELRKEQERLARSREITRTITEGVYSTNPAFDPRYTGGKR